MFFIALMLILLPIMGVYVGHSSASNSEPGILDVPFILVLLASIITGLVFLGYYTMVGAGLHEPSPYYLILTSQPTT